MDNAAHPSAAKLFANRPLTRGGQTASTSTSTVRAEHRCAAISRGETSTTPRGTRVHEALGNRDENTDEWRAGLAEARDFVEDVFVELDLVPSG
jgi:hypothetical protein